MNPPLTVVDATRRLWEAIADGDVSRVRELLAEDVVWHSHGRNALSGDHRGHDGVLDYLALAGELTDEMVLTLRRIFVAAETTVVEYDLRATRGARRLEVLLFLRLEWVDGRVRRRNVIPFDQADSDRFWS